MYYKKKEEDEEIYSFSFDKYYPI